MAATKYQLLYRYINEATNTAITNSMENEYIKAEEFYTAHHKIYDSDPNTKIEAENEKEEMISFGNSPDNPKNDMMFAYDGTKKIRHKKWIPEVKGCYVIRDWQKLDRKLIGNRGDFTKDFITLDKDSPEVGGVVVCRNLTINNKYSSNVNFMNPNVIVDNSMADNGTPSNPYYSEGKAMSIIKDSTIFKLKDGLSISDFQTLGATPIQTYPYNSRNPSGTIYTGSICVGQNNLTKITYYPYYSNITTTHNNASNSNTGLYNILGVKTSNIETKNVPGHYEEVVDDPYIIKDTYKRIQMSPWFVHATYGSLETALEKAKILVDMIGLENVKLVKIVPFDQFVEIQ